MSTEKEVEPIMIGDPVIRRNQSTNSSEWMPWRGERAASDPWETYPGMWQIAVQQPDSNNGMVIFELLADVRKANIPDEVLKLRCQP